MWCAGTQSSAPGYRQRLVLRRYLACRVSFPASVTAPPQTVSGLGDTLWLQFGTLGTNMKKILAGAAALLGTAVSTQAADMAVKAPYLKAPVAMVYDWPGFYMGESAGVGIGRDYPRLTIPARPSFEASYLNPQ